MIYFSHDAHCSINQSLMTGFDMSLNGDNVGAEAW